MYNYFFGKRQNIAEETPSNVSSKISPQVSTEKHNVQTQIRNSFRKKTTKAQPSTQLNSDSFKNADPRFPTDSAYSAKLNTRLNLESLDPNSMMPLYDLNEKLAACKVCGRMFSPRRITTHQDICARMAQKEEENDRRWPKPWLGKPPSNLKPGSTVKPAPNLRRASIAKRTILVKHTPTVKQATNQTAQDTPAKHTSLNMSRLAKPEPSSRKLPPTSSSKFSSKPRPLTAKPDLNDMTIQKKNILLPPPEQATSYKRPLSAFPSIFPKMFAKPKIEVDERVTCPTCNRKFNVTSAAHHIPWCKKQAAMIKTPKPPPRKKYVVPKLRLASKDGPAQPEKIQQMRKIGEKVSEGPVERATTASRRIQSTVADRNTKPKLPNSVAPSSCSSRRGSISAAEREPSTSRRLKPQKVEQPRTPSYNRPTTRYSR